MTQLAGHHDWGFDEILQDLKVKLRRLRAKLRKLKAEYKYSEDEEESEKSEMSTLQDLKRATEQAIRELQIEAAKASKRKGLEVWFFELSAKNKNTNPNINDALMLILRCQKINFHSQIPRIGWKQIQQVEQPWGPGYRLTRAYRVK